MQHGPPARTCPPPAGGGLPSRGEALRDVYLFLRGLALERRARLEREATARQEPADNP